MRQRRRPGALSRAVPSLFVALVASATLAVSHTARGEEPTHVGGARGRVRVSPDQPLQPLIDAAEPGATLVLAPGEHRGPVTLTRPLTIRGERGARIVGNGQGSVVTIEADGVRIDRLEVRRSGRNLSKDDAGILIFGDDVQVTDVQLSENLHGVYVHAGAGVRLRGLHVIGLAATEEGPEVIGAEEAHREDAMHHSPPSARSLMGNGLHLFDADGAIVEGNHIHHVRDGIYVAHTNNAEFRANRIHDSRYGIHYMYSSDNVMAANELWDNVAGPALMFSRNLQVMDNVLRDHGGFRAYGLLLQNVDASAIHGNQIHGNRVGMRLQNSSANEFRSNRIDGNLTGVTITPSSRDNALTRNRFGMNLRQVALPGPVPPAQWSVDGEGNEWNGALPLDLTGDGISNWPHHEVDLMAERRERFPEIQLLIGSAGIRVVEWALSRAPVPGTRHITDPHPLVRPRDRARR